MNAFTVWVGLGSAMGLWRVWRLAPSRLSGALLNTALLVLFAALLGARLAYVIVNIDYFRANFWEIFQFWQGGLSWPGALAGAAAAIAATAHAYSTPHGRRVPIGWLADRLYPLLPPVAITAWLGCWLTGAAYGAALPEGSWFGTPTLDETGAYLHRLPVQILAALALLAFFALVELLFRPKRPHGALSALALAGLMLVQLGASLLRADPAPTWQGLRLDAWFAVAVLALLLLLALVHSLVPILSRRQSISDQT